MKSTASAWKSALAGATFLAVLTAALPAQAAETVKIFRSTMPDGSIVLGDKPTSGASSVASDTIVLTAPRGAADAERDYWRRQSEGFNLRQQQRDSVQRSRRAMSPAYGDDLAMYGDDMQPRVSYYGHSSVNKPLVPPHLVPRDYATSPGAVRGRSSGFIGSGFSTSR
jgi:hypothetical protein